MVKTSFDPRVNSFAFDNNFKWTAALEARFEGLCGGMVFVALDYFCMRVTLPTQTTRPNPGSTLYEYINKRFWDSINAAKGDWLGLIVDPFPADPDADWNESLDKSAGGKTGQLKQRLAVDKPTPIGLFKDGGGGLVSHHVVLATGISYAEPADPLQRLQLSVYDPNWPKFTRTLIPNPGHKRWVFQDEEKLQLSDRCNWRSFFPILNYVPQQPPVIAQDQSPTSSAIGSLHITIATGKDNLRGGNDNVDITVVSRSGTQQSFRNVNVGKEWVDHHEKVVVLPLNPRLPRGEIAAVELHTNFGGGLGGENWDVRRIMVCADGDPNQELARAEPEGFRLQDDQPVVVRFTGSTHVFPLRTH